MFNRFNFMLFKVNVGFGVEQNQTKRAFLTRFVCYAVMPMVTFRTPQWLPGGRPR